MFVIDVSRTMGKTRTVDLPPGPNGEERSKEMSNLEWALQYVKLKIQEMVRSLSYGKPNNANWKLVRSIMGGRLTNVAWSYLARQVRNPHFLYE
jgi:hypothetical protein